MKRESKSGVLSAYLTAIHIASQRFNLNFKLDTLYSYIILSVCAHMLGIIRPIRRCIVKFLTAMQTRTGGRKVTDQKDIRKLDCIWDLRLVDEV